VSEPIRSDGKLASNIAEVEQTRSHGWPCYTHHRSAQRATAASGTCRRARTRQSRDDERTSKRWTHHASPPWCVPE